MSFSFAGMGTVDGNQSGGSYFNADHRYRVRLERAFIKVSQDPKKAGAQMMIFEFTVLGSTDPEIVEGASRSQVISQDAYGQWRGNLKNVLDAIIEVQGWNPDAVFDAHGVQIASFFNANGAQAAGCVLDLQTRSKPKKHSAGDFTIHDYSAPSGEAPKPAAGAPVYAASAEQFSAAAAANPAPAPPAAFGGFAGPAQQQPSPFGGFAAPPAAPAPQQPNAYPTTGSPFGAVPGPYGAPGGFAGGFDPNKR